MLEYVLFPFYLLVHLQVVALGHISWAMSYTDEGPPIRENYVAVLGPRYGSSKLDIPGTTLSAWWYSGDEPSHGECVPGAGEIDENSYAHRISDRWPTANLRGDESR